MQFFFPFICHETTKFIKIMQDGREAVCIIQIVIDENPQD